MKTTDRPRIYIASLTDYNSGILHGEWVDVTTPDEIRESVEKIMASSPSAKTEGCIAEEWAIHDYEGFGAYKVSESADFDDLCELADLAEKHGEALYAFVDNGNSADTFEDCFLGEYDSLEDYAQEYLDGSGELDAIPQNLRYYFDYKSYASDLETNGDIFTLENGSSVWVFVNR